MIENPQSRSSLQLLRVCFFIKQVNWLSTKGRLNKVVRYGRYLFFAERLICFFIKSLGYPIGVWIRLW